MPSKASSSSRTPENLARLGEDILHHRVEPHLTSQDTGKFVAIAVDDGDFELHDDDHTAVSKLLARHPEAQVWLTRVGQPATYRIGKSL
jgi:enoyl reductase-like protein